MPGVFTCFRVLVEHVSVTRFYFDLDARNELVPCRLSLHIHLVRSNEFSSDRRQLNALHAQIHHNGKSSTRGPLLVR